MLRAVLFDLDGTAVPSSPKGMPSGALIHAVREARSGLRLCAATGRSWPFARPIIASLELDDPCIISGGTVIVDPITQKILWQVVLPAEAVRQIAAVTSLHRYHVAYAAGIETKTDLRGPDLLEAGQINTVYILDIPAKEALAMARALAHIPGITPAKVDSHRVPGAVDFHITSRTATKEHAVHALAKLIDIPAAAMAGVGDGLNDIHLFNAVGYKVAMGNAVPELKAEADEVIEPLDQEGLAKYILDLC